MRAALILVAAMAGAMIPAALHADDPRDPTMRTAEARARDRAIIRQLNRNELARVRRRELLPADKRSLHRVADDMRHELGTCYVVKNRGLVVQSSCSHRGILNAVRRAREVSGIDHVHAVIGGFHLVWPRTEQDAVRTVDELQDIDPDYIIPMHWSVEAFIAEALRRMPGKVIRPYVGSRFVFGQVS